MLRGTPKSRQTNLFHGFMTSMNRSGCGVNILEKRACWNFASKSCSTDANPWNSTRNSQGRPMSRYVMGTIFPVFSTGGHFYFGAGYFQTDIRNFYRVHPIGWGHRSRPGVPCIARSRAVVSGAPANGSRWMRHCALPRWCGAHAAPQQPRDIPVGGLDAGTGTSPQLVLRICLILRHRRLSGGGRRPLPRPRAHRPAPAPCARTSGPWHLRSSASSAPWRPWAAAASSPSASRDSHRA